MEDRIKVLVVEDDATNVEIVEIILEDMCTIKIASSGEEALEVIYGFEPNVVLLDIMMPGINGYETCKIIRKDEKWKDTPIILVSAKAMPEELKEGIDSGANDFLTKPFHHEDLSNLIKKYGKKPKIS